MHKNYLARFRYKSFWLGLGEDHDLDLSDLVTEVCKHYVHCVRKVPKNGHTGNLHGVLVYAFGELL